MTGYYKNGLRLSNRRPFFLYTIFIVIFLTLSISVSAETLTTLNTNTETTSATKNTTTKNLKANKTAEPPNQQVKLIDKRVNSPEKEDLVQSKIEQKVTEIETREVVVKKSEPVVDYFSELKFATPELSVRLIDEYQPNRKTDPQVWFVWEKKRLQLMSEIGDWQSIVKRIENFDKNTLIYQQQWLELFRARALLKISRTDKVRQNLRGLLWSENKMTTEQMATARRLIIRSYLAENKSQDAQRAMLRYQQDYGVSGSQWRLLQARVLIATKKYQQAMSLLAGTEEKNLQAFKMWTKLLAGESSAIYIYKKSIEMALSVELEHDINNRRQYWILAYIAAGMTHNKIAEIEALESALVTGVEDAEHDLININAGLLWDKYIQYAAELGNRLHLLIGDDEVWFINASDRFESEPVEARVMFAMLGLKAVDDNHKSVSLEQLALIMKKLDKGNLLIERMFLYPAYFESLSRVPVSVRYHLLDVALSQGKISQAAELFKLLPEPPDGEKRLAWDVRRARVLVLGGQYQQGKDVLQHLLAKTLLDETSLNRLMQVVFDLQKVDQHKLAIELFKFLEKKTTDVQLHRELQFWMAESYQSLKQYERSAHLYLISAMMIEEKQGDPWSQTAQYRAAENMMLAGLINDARTLYQKLLKITKNPNRRANIKQQLQQLWLLEGKQGHVSN